MTRVPYEKVQEITREWPEEALDMWTSYRFTETMAEEIERTAKMYGIDMERTDNLTGLIADVLYGAVALGDFPSFIEMDCQIDRKTALQAAIRLSRHILKLFSGYIPIGNIDAYIVDWREELEGL